MNSTLVSRALTAAQLYYTSNDAPTISSERHARKACSEMGIDPLELCTDDSEVWQSILLLRAAAQGRTVFTFRGSGTEETTEQVIDHLLHQAV